MLQSIINQTGKAALQHIDPNNRIFCAVTSGSKGTPINISQIMACVGQQSVEGQRINVKEGKLSCYTSKDEGNPHKHGFVQHSYFRGLSPQEYYFHAMGGREGLVDTAVKTAATGYISRRLVKVMESIQVAEDLTVRTSGREIIQFQYGGDNFDATFLEKIRAPYLLKSSEALRERALCAEPPAAWGWTAAQRRAWRNASEAEAEAQARLWARLRRTAPLRLQMVEDVQYLPVCVERLLQQPQFYVGEDARVRYHRPWERTGALVARAKSSSTSRPRWSCTCATGCAPPSACEGD